MRTPPLGRTGRQWRLARVCPRTAFLRNFVGELCRNRPFSTELRQSVSTKIDDKVGNESFGTSSSYATQIQSSRRPFPGRTGINLNESHAGAWRLVRASPKVLPFLSNPRWPALGRPD